MSDTSQILELDTSFYSGRLDRDSYYIIMAGLVSMRGTCKKQKVGCVLVNKGRTISMGYNSSHPNTPHCTFDQDGCILNKDGRCRKTLHSEVSAVLELKDNYKDKGFTAYITHHPCSHCYQVLCGAGCNRIVYRHPPYYPNDDENEILNRLIREIGVVPTQAVLSNDKITLNI